MVLAGLPDRRALVRRSRSSKDKRTGKGRSNVTGFGTQDVQTRNYFVLPERVEKLDVLALLREVGAPAEATAVREEAWVL